jgi:hypothetical protein
VQAYLAKGGKLVLGLRMLDLEGKTWSRTGLEDLAERHGVKLEDAYAVDAGKLLQPHPLLADITIKNYAFAADDGWEPKHPIGKAMAGKPLRVDAPRVLTVATRPGFETSAVLSTGSGKDAWGERDLYANRVGYDEKKDVKGPVPLIVASKETKKNGARVVVLGSWLLMANYKLDPNLQAIDYTKELILNIFNWVTEQEMLVALAPRRPEHIKLALTEKQVASAGRTVILFLPLIAVCLALIAWMAPTVSQRRSRRASDAAGRGAAGPQGGAR